MVKATLEDRLKVSFREPLNQTETENLLQYLAQELKARINYRLQTHRHVGTIDPEADPKKFKIKQDKKTIGGDILLFYRIEFIIEQYEKGGYYQIKFSPPSQLENPAEEYYNKYYRFVERVKNKIKRYKPKNK